MTYEEFKHRHTISFRNAFNGLKWALSTQPNFVIHLVAFLAVSAASLAFQISLGEYLVIVLISALVIVAELLNTALEAATDITKFLKDARIIKDSDKIGYVDHLIGVSKDVAAGAVLAAAAASVLVAALIFLPRIF